MTLDQLQYFVAAAQYEHINRAARSFPISASAVSNAVRELEAEFNCQLFIRDKKRIRITPTGSRFLELAQNLLSQAEHMKTEIGNAPTSLSGHYRMGASQFLATKVLSPAWTLLQEKNPRLTADVCSLPTWVLVENLLAGRLDFAVGFNTAQHPQLECEEIFRGVSEVVVRKNHPIFRRVRSNHYKLLSEYSATMHMASERLLAERPHPALRAAGIFSSVKFSYDSDYVAIENLRRSNNWCFMLDIVVSEFAAHLRRVPLPKTIKAEYTIQIIKNKARRTDAAMAEAFKTIRDTVRELWG